MDSARRHAAVSGPVRAYRRFRHRKPRLPAGVTVGRHTYGFEKDTFFIYTEGARIDVGAFCSIGPQVKVHGGGEHVMDRASTFPMNARLFDPDRRSRPDEFDKGPTVVGNDVWIGMGATVLAGVSIGDGAVIGARAVVTKDVEPYAIAVGNPARVIRRRFDQETCERLLALRWWDWSDSELQARRSWFIGDVEDFLREAEALTVRSPGGRGAARGRVA
jgi:acetyltransferase-like isoleucine patch superfamily enzyme